MASPMLNEKIEIAPQRRESRREELKFISRILSPLVPSLRYESCPTISSAARLETLYKKIKAIELRTHLEEQNEVRAKKYYDAVIKEYNRGDETTLQVKLRLRQEGLGCNA